MRIPRLDKMNMLELVKIIRLLDSADRSETVEKAMFQAELSLLRVAHGKDVRIHELTEALKEVQEMFNVEMRERV